MLLSGAWGKVIHEKNLKQKISWHCPFKPGFFRPEKSVIWGVADADECTEKEKIKDDSYYFHNFYLPDLKYSIVTGKRQYPVNNFAKFVLYRQ